MASKIQFKKPIHFYFYNPFVNNNFAFINKLLTIPTIGLTVNKVI